MEAIIKRDPQQPRIVITHGQRHPGAEDRHMRLPGEELSSINLPSPPPVLGNTCPLLGSRQFVMDMARLAEQIIMDDVLCDYWPAVGEPEAEFQARISCREKAAFPDKCGDINELAEVRRRRARWATDICQRYRPNTVVWCDTAIGLEKQAAVLLLHPPGEKPVAVVVWRGSKKLSDYLRTDVSLSFVPVRAEGEQGGHRHRWKLLREAVIGRGTPMFLTRGSHTPCVTRGLWEAYAGAGAREHQGLGPRGVVRGALEKLLVEQPGCRICITGHSLGGALATLCAHDLLTTSPVMAARGATMISFASPRFFNRAFQQATSALQVTSHYGIPVQDPGDRSTGSQEAASDGSWLSDEHQS